MDDSPTLTPVTAQIAALKLPMADTPAAPGTESLSFDWLSTDRLVIDRRFQRMVSNAGKARIARGAATFDWRKFGAIIVSPIDGGNFAITDGQHRALMAIAAHITKIPCIIYTGSQAEQAAAFVGINVNRTTVPSVDKFRARAASREEHAVLTQEILTELEINIDVPAGSQLRAKDTRAVATIEKLVKRIGRGWTFTTLETLLDAQPDEPGLLTSFTIEAASIATAKIIEAGGDLNRLLKVFQQTNFETLADEAKQLVAIKRGKRVHHGSELLLFRYNKHQRSKIST